MFFVSVCLSPEFLIIEIGGFLSIMLYLRCPAITEGFLHSKLNWSFEAKISYKILLPETYFEHSDKRNF